MTKVAILASHNGSGFNALYQASITKELSIQITLLVSNNTHSPALKNAQDYGIKNQLVNAKTDACPDSKLYNLLIESQCEYIFLSGYMKKLPPRITNTFKVINAHPSLLPKYGGAGMYGRFVHEAVIKNKETKSGITFHEVNEVYDEGKIILQKELFLDEDETVESLEDRIKALEVKAIIEGFELCLK